MPERRLRSQRTNTPLGRALRYVGLLAGIVIGWEIGSVLRPSGTNTEELGYALLWASILGALFFLLTPYLTIEFFKWLHHQVRRLSAIDLIVVGIAVVVGGVVSALLAWPISLLPDPFGQFLPAAAAVAICTLAIFAGVTKKRELQSFMGRKEPGPVVARNGDAPQAILLDTSAIIDGRIAELARTGLLQSDLIVPQFVLRELQLVADSSDPSRRDRGRRGLEVLERLKQVREIQLVITDLDAPDEIAVDDKLVRVAQRDDYRVLTGDQNLERVAGLQGVRVINIHQLAHVLRPPLVPGEEIVLKIVQPGREYGQGVGFLDDGTMVVVEAGKNLIGQDVKIVVTRTLQTGAGRMAFAQVFEEQSPERPVVR